MGVNPISYTEMDAYFRLNDIQVFDFEVKAIKALDNLMIKIHSEKQKQEEQANQNKAKSKK